MDIRDIGSQLEQIESETAGLSEQKAALESKEQELSEAISKLREDVAVSDVLRAGEAQTGRELEQTETKLQSYRSQVEALEESLQALSEELQNSESVIQQLEALGENVSEGLSILEARRQLLEECERQLQDIVARLEMDSVSLNLGEQGDQSAAAAAQEAGQESGDNRQEDPQKQRQPWEEAPPGAKGAAALSTPDLIDAAHRTQRLRTEMESALAGNPERKAEWDVVRGRLSAEYASAADALKQRADALDDEFHRFQDHYVQVLGEAQGSPEKMAAMEPMRAKYSAMLDQLRTLRSEENNARTESEYLASGLRPEDRTTMASVSGRGLTEISGMLISQQGEAVPDFWGTCGCCASADASTLLGVPCTEKQAVEIARSEKACVDWPIRSIYPEKLKNKIRCMNGGTLDTDREKILGRLGFQVHTERPSSLAQIASEVQAGKGAILSMESGVLNKTRSVKSTRPYGRGHAVTVTGVEFNANGDAVGLWLHDTGGISTMGTEFFCSAADFDMVKNSTISMVQFVWKKATE